LKLAITIKNIVKSNQKRFVGKFKSLVI